ncbi:MAG: AAA family ATPase, partial [Planctomycetaceae bacterium]|nr:AAA family ATPase [Planctomycetaceae bacterium]
MNAKKIKQLPYGNADFKRIRIDNYVYIDKTRFIELLEEEGNLSQILIRPRRFGKSLFLSTLSYYYDANYANEFEQLFGDLYIGRNPTPRKNSYAVMAFNFSGIDTTSAENFRNSFVESIYFTVRQFLHRHKNIFPKAEQFIEQINKEKNTQLILNTAFGAADEAGIKIFVIIDEYDHFANDLIAMGTVLGEDFYKKVITANGLVRDFYEKLKIATDNGIVDRTFITGISPIMLEDLTSGYNIVTNYSLKLRYNEMLGFTREEVNLLMDTVGIDSERISVDMEYYYNGYLFNGEAVNKVYNPSMILYFFEQILETNKLPANLIDPNLSIDPQRLRRLIKNESNRDILIQIIKEGGIVSGVLEKFSIDHLSDNNHFVSLLFYMGLLTIKESYLGELRLVIPNYSIQTTFWSYLRVLVQDHSPEIMLNLYELTESIRTMAMKGNIHDFINYVSQNAFSKLSDYDLQCFDEKYIKVLLLAYLLLNNIYIP